MIDALHAGYMLKGLLGNKNTISEGLADAPQSIESSVLRNTFYSKNEFIYTTQHQQKAN